jgi:hypothetical protein
MTVRCLFFIAPVFLLTAGQVSSHLSQVRLLSLKIFDLFLDVGQETVDLLNRDRAPERCAMRRASFFRMVNHTSPERRLPDHVLSLRLDHCALLRL